jgi:hypothetical protein
LLLRVRQVLARSFRPGRVTAQRGALHSDFKLDRQNDQSIRAFAKPKVAAGTGRG